MAVAPEREDSYIWLGRRLGYLTRWSEAIEVFGQGLERFPDSYKLLRYRGRHYARTRQFEKARAVVQQIPEGLTLLENSTYYESVLFFRGMRTEEDILPGADAVIKLAIAMEFSFRGDNDAAKRILREIVEGSAQGFWPAESELVTMGG